MSNSSQDVEWKTPRTHNVLIVDDDPGDVFLVKQALQKTHKNIRIEHVPDGIEALNFLRKLDEYGDSPTPDIVILDLNMPRMNGLETLDHVRADTDLRTLPIIVLTTSDSESDIRQAYEKQATCFIKKPVELDALTAMLGQLSAFWFDLVRYPS